MNRVRIFILALSSLAYLATVRPVCAQKEGKGTQKTVFVTCWDEKTKKYGSRSVHGASLVSPDGLQKAYAKVDALALGNTDSGGKETCQNKSALFVARDGKVHFDSVYAQQGVKGEAQGNGVQLIDWSADSKILVADLLTWYYNSEGWEHHIIVYSTQTGTVQKKSLEALFSAALHKDCGLEAQLKGFLRDGRVAVKARPLDEEEGLSCVKQDSMWAIDISNFKVSPLTKPEEIKQNGKLRKSD